MMGVKPGVQDGGEGGLVGLRAGVRLDVDVFGLEEFFGALAGEIFHLVGILAAAVVALAGVAFGVFVGEDAAGGFEDGLRGEVLAGDELDLAVLAARFREDEFVDGGVYFGEVPLDRGWHGCVGLVMPNSSI